MSNRSQADPIDDAANAGMAKVILNLVGRAPDSRERESERAGERAESIARTAARRAALTAGGLALPPGPLGWLTILPELLAVWRIQSQMVADIAGLYGKDARLTREQMIYCLFKHTSAMAVRDLVVRAGERYLVRHVSLSVLHDIAGRIGANVTRKVLGKSVSRWLPLIGAAGVGAYAYFDTTQVARNAMALFESTLKNHPEDADTIDG